MAYLDALFDTKQCNGPESLTSLCYKFICEHMEVLSTRHYDQYVLREGIILPNEICDKLVEYAKSSEAIDKDNKFFTLFEDTKATNLKRVKVNGFNITESAVEIIVSHKVTDLEFVNCTYLRNDTIEHINANSENLINLSFRNCPSLFTSQKYVAEYARYSEYRQRGYVLEAPRLKRLVLDGIPLEADDYPHLFRGLQNLIYLDITNNSEIKNFRFYECVQNLVSLNLYNVRNISEPMQFISNLCQLKNLRHLDISQDNIKYGTYINPNMALAKLIEGLPNLSSLDISGTNLAGRGVAQRVSEKTDLENDRLCDIPGLASRMSNPLRFLGLYGTQYEACRRHDIPAEMITGDANEEQILLAAKVYMDNKQDMLLKILNDLYFIFKTENCKRMDQALCTVLDAMEKYPLLNHVQISGSATIFYIVKSKENHAVVSNMKRRIIGALITGMVNHKEEETMMRNGCLALCQFRIPQDVMWNYEALVKVLLHSAKHSEPEGFVQRIGIYLLNSLACQVEGREKRLLGKLGCVETMLRLVKYRMDSGVFDVLEVAWSTMWNMTDETPINCERFLVNNGLSLFLKCFKRYPLKEELLRNMMGLLGNVAEVKGLRKDLMNEEYVTVFNSLLQMHIDGIEVSYNAAGILAHMASDGVEAWTVEKPTREEVLNSMVVAIGKWDLNAERNINYRSFLPLLRLIDVYHTPECQLWAVWALANLTNVYPHKYCSLVVMEGGIEKLQNLLAAPRTESYRKVKILAQRVIDRCNIVNTNTGDASVDYINL